MAMNSSGLLSPDLVFRRDAEYWRTRLSGLAGVRVPGDPNSGPGRPATARARRELPVGLVRALQGIATSYEVSLFVLTLAAFEVVLSRWTGFTDIAVLCPATPQGGGTANDGGLAQRPVRRSAFQRPAGTARG